ncbi:hypothetical protein ACFXG4_18005, partial [Nocardia sp. NPDC059246]
MATVEETYLPLPRDPGTEVLLTCGNGFPLAVALSGANVNDHLLLPTLLDRVRPLRGRAGRPRHRITNLIADKGTTTPACIPNCGNDVSPATFPAAAPATRSPPAAGSSNNPCAPRSGVSYPRLSREGLEGRFLGRMADLM